MDDDVHLIQVNSDNQPAADRTQQRRFPSFHLLVKQLFAEMIGSALIYFLVAMTINLFKYQSSVAHAFILLCLWMIAQVVVSLKHITSHFNPAITITLAIFKQFSWGKVPPYIVAQTLGYTMGFGTLIVAYSNLFRSNEMSKVFDRQALTWEMTILCIFVFSVVWFGYDGHQNLPILFSGVIIGTIIIANTVLSTSNSAASTDPEMHTQEAVLKSAQDQLVMYIIAPTLVCIFAGGLGQPLRIYRQI